jgi:tetratricopeptide (TPR) repeat protein
MDTTFQSLLKERQEARERLDAIIVTEPNNESAWLQLAEVVDYPNEAVNCLEQALAINPNNIAASQKLKQLKQVVKAEEKAEEALKPVKSRKHVSSHNANDAGSCLVEFVGSFILDFILTFILSLIFPSNS